MKKGRSQGQARPSGLSESMQQDIAPQHEADARRMAMQKQKERQMQMEEAKHRNLLDDMKMKKKEMDEKKNRFSWTSYSILTQTII